MCPFHTYCKHTHTHCQPGVLCKVTPRMPSLSSSSSPATILQAECRLDTDQPHASRSNEQCEPNGRASGGGERLLSYFTLTETTAVENVNVFHMIRLFGDSRRPSITFWNGCHSPWRFSLCASYFSNMDTVQHFETMAHHSLQDTIKIIVPKEWGTTSSIVPQSTQNKDCCTITCRSDVHICENKTKAGEQGSGWEAVVC